MAENCAEPVRTMAVSFIRKPFLFSEVLSTVLGRFISEIDSQYAENMRYSHPRWVRPNWLIDSLESISSSKTIVKNFNRLSPIFGYGNKFSIAGDNRHSKHRKMQHLVISWRNPCIGRLDFCYIIRSCSCFWMDHKSKKNLQFNRSIYDVRK